MMRTSTLGLVFAALLAVPVARAQGNLSTLGFGYPSGGQLSTRALGAGGATGDLDPLSVSNPASIAAFGGSVLYFQLEPEYRTLHVAGATEQTSIARYPLVVASIPLFENFMLGLSFSNLLDRSFETNTRGFQTVGDTSLAVSNIFKSDGAIGDVRVALAWTATSWLHLGVAAHAITGDNRIKNTQTFDDSTQFAQLVDTATVGYTGNAYTGGFEINAFDFSIAGAYRKGGPLSLKRADTTLSNAHVPDRVSFSAAYLGIKGTAIAFRRSKDSWSNMQGLGSNGVKITDAWDTSVGADVMGPKIGERNVQLRAGARWRTLPFGLATTSVSEKSYSLGLGTTMARGRAAFDLAGIRAIRDAGVGLQETSTTLSFGVTVRP